MRVMPFLPRLEAALRRQLAASRAVLAGAAARLDALSPLAVLARGYAIASSADGRVIADAAEVPPGDAIDVRVQHGVIAATVVARDSR